MADSTLLEKNMVLALKRLNNVLQDVLIYPREHPELLRMLDHCLELLNLVFEHQKEIVILFIDKEVILNNRPNDTLTSSSALLIEKILSKKINRLVFIKGVNREDLLNFCHYLNESGSGHGKTSDPLKKRTFYHIVCERVGISRTSGFDENRNSAEKGEDPSINLLSREMNKAENLDYDYLVRYLSHITPQIINFQKELLFSGTLKAYNQNSFDHVLNVSVLSSLMGAALSFSETGIRQLSIAGLFHDIGKNQIPLEILNKHGKLTEEERRIMERHPELGAKSILFQPDFDETALIAAFEHHQNLDGLGYPPVNKKRAQHLISRIVAICDVYDALRGTRVYIGEMSPEEAYALMQDMKGKKFDPDLLDLFFQTIGVYPVGIKVELDTGEKAVVVKPNPDDIFRPDVYLLGSEETEFTPELLSRTSVSLMEKNNEGYRRSIVKSFPPVYGN